MRKRVFYGISTLVLLFIEVVIALFVHDEFIRPYIGDVLVVILIYTLIRTIVPERIKILPLLVFIFAVGVECLQYIHIVELLGVWDNRFLRVLIGGTFDIKDIGCYFIGCLILGVYEWMNSK